MRRLLLLSLLLVPSAAWSAPIQEEERVAKALKEAEREGFQRRHLDTYFRVFTKDARWTFGRRAVADEHDYVLSSRAYRTQLTGRWKQGASGNERVFFRTLSVNLETNQGTAEGQLVRHFFGGSERLGRIYQLTKKKSKWRVKAVRTWSFETTFGADQRIYDDEYLLNADQTATAAKTDETQPLVVRISNLVAAGWINVAYEIAKVAVERSPKSVDALRASAQLGFTLGHFRDARRLAKRLRVLDPSIQLAPGL